MPDLTSRKYLIPIAVITLGLYVCGLSSQYKLTPDSCEYVGTAESLVAGQGLQFNHVRGSIFPPLFALSMAGVTRLVGQDEVPILLMKLLQTVLAVLLAVGTWRLAGKFVSANLARLTGILVLTNITVFQHTMYILSDMLYACLTIWSIVLLEESQTEGKGKWIGGLLLASLAWLTRSVGLTLAGAIFIWSLTSTRTKSGWRQYALAILAPVFVALPWLWWRLSFPTGGLGYMEYWMEITGEKTLAGILVNRLSEMVPILLMRITQIVLNIESGQFHWYFQIPVMMVILTGYAGSWRKKPRLLSWYLLLYMAVMSVWFDQGTRFYLPVLPGLLIFAMLGLDTLRLKLTALSEIRKEIFTVLGLLVICLLLWAGIFSGGRMAPMELVRNGGIYCLPALVVLVLMLSNRITRISRTAIRLMAVLGFLGLYVLIQWGYTGTYALLEHRVLRSREPMFMGYQRYYQMGLWLKEHRDIPAPVLCSNSSIVHLVSGQITCQPQLTARGNYQMFQSGQAKSLLVLRQPELAGPNYGTDLEIVLIQQLLDAYGDHFRMISLPDNERTYLVYEYAGK